MPAVALVTGGNRGIGLGITQRLLADGFAVSILATREEPTELLESLDAPGRVRYVRGSVADLEDHARFVDDAVEAWGRLDLLVNNAGVAPSVRADLLEAGPESFDRVLGINLRGPVLPDADVRQPRDRARLRRPSAGHGDQRVEHLRDHRLHQPRRLLHLQGRRRDGHAAVRGAPGTRGHRRLRGAARRDRHRHDRGRHREVRRPDRRRVSRPSTAGADRPTSPARCPSWRPARPRTRPARCSTSTAACTSRCCDGVPPRRPRRHRQHRRRRHRLRRVLRGRPPVGARPDRPRHGRRQGQRRLVAQRRLRQADLLQAHALGRRRRLRAGDGRDAVLRRGDGRRQRVG